MKKTKRFFSTLMAMIFFFAVSSPIYYADNEAEAGGGEQVVGGGTGSITLNNPQPNTTYKLYKIFDMTMPQIATSTDSSPSINSYAYTVATDWEGFFEADGLGSSFLIDADKATEETHIKKYPILHNGKIKYIQLDENNSAKSQQFTRLALQYIVAKDIPSQHESTAGSNTSLEIKDLKLGYYLIYPVGATQYLENSGTICSLTSSQPKASINIKSEYPTITNVLTDDKGNELTDKENFYRQIGDRVYYKIKGTIPDFTPYKNGYTYKIFLKLSPGQWENTGGESTQSKINYLYINSNPIDSSTIGIRSTFENKLNVFIFDFTDGAKELIGQPFELRYSTIVSPNAAEETATTNEAILNYTIDPQKGSTASDNIGEFPCTAIEIYTCNIDITKFCKKSGSDTTNIPLENAKFALYQEQNGTDTKLYYQYYVYDTNDDNMPLGPDKIRWSKTAADQTIVTTDNEGKGLFQGLGLGTYYLEETKAPDGFNKLAEPIKIDILFDNEEGHAIYKINDAENMPDGVGSSLKITNNHLSVPVEVENKAGSLLPGTGGIGTVIFTITGVALIAAAGLFLLRKKQSEKVSEQ